MKFPRRKEATRQLKTYFGLAILLALLLGLGGAQTALAQVTPPAGMTMQALIPIHCTAATPNCLHDWTTTGAATRASSDIFALDFSANVMYFTDRVNQGVDVINTTNNTYLGTIPVPSCNVAGAIPGSCPSGVVVTHNPHKLVVTDRNTSVSGTTVHLNSIFIYDLRIPNSAPVQLHINTTGTDTDELDFDPLNRRVYVANTNCPCVVTVVDITNNTIVDTIPLPSNPEQPRFNPVDGKIYLTLPDDGTIATGGPADGVYVIDPTQTGATALSKFITAPSGCAVRGIDIDPVTNTAVIGCASPAAQFALDLTTGTILGSFPGVTGTDGLEFNPNLRRWYTGSSNNLPALTACPQSADTPPVAPVIGVFAAVPKPKKNNPPVINVGADCSGVNAHGIGVDTVGNQVYVAARQFPVSPASLSANNAGVLVYQDTAPLVQPKLKEMSNVKVVPAGGSTVSGRVAIDDGYIISASLSGLGSGTTALVVTTTAGNERVSCDVSSGNGTCQRVLVGQALLGGRILVSTDGTLVANAIIK
jgi:hypothetical protein